MPTSSGDPCFSCSRFCYSKTFGRSPYIWRLTRFRGHITDSVCIKSYIRNGKSAGRVVGAGTITKSIDVKDAINAGANFAVSPGSTDDILETCAQQNLPILPGAATSTEIMRLFDLGYSVQKFFPAEAIGGQATLKAIGGPLPNVKFCPTGGITINNAKGYLELENTLCVGGSWVAPQHLIENKDWKSITELARKASKIAL